MFGNETNRPDYLLRVRPGKSKRGQVIEHLVPLGTEDVVPVQCVRRNDGASNNSSIWRKGVCEIAQAVAAEPGRGATFRGGTEDLYQPAIRKVFSRLVDTNGAAARCLLVDHRQLVFRHLEYFVFIGSIGYTNLKNPILVCADWTAITNNDGANRGVSRRELYVIAGMYPLGVWHGLAHQGAAPVICSRC